MMNKNPHLTIVGAGPAGTSLAIRLAQENFDVCLIEKSKFPRQKLCGEFISPECFRHFRNLGVFEEMLAAGGERISETHFYAPNGKSVGVPSEWFGGDSGGALSLSRAEMDFQLLEKAKSIGVRVLEESTVVGVKFEKEKLCSVEIRTKDNHKEEIFADLFVDATGRARILGKLAEKENFRKNADARMVKIRKPKSKIQNSFVGFKTHLKNVNLEKGACEIYFFEGGYGGLSYVENNLANFCFLIKAEAVKIFSSDAQQIIEHLVFQNVRARETLENAVPVHDWLAVSVEGFGKKDLNSAPNLYAVGDAGAFIDPFTGSGMLMAFESAEILAQVIAETAFSLEKTAEIYEKLHREKFRKRLLVCSLLRRAAFVPSFAKLAISALSLSERARIFLAQATRQTFATDKNK